jgi:branched-subunit amino acid transport protein
MNEINPWFTLLCAALATYGWRFLGVLVSGRIDTDGPVFRWFTSVAYAMLAALSIRMILLPTGPLVDTPLIDRVVGFGAALLVYFLCRRSLLAGVLTAALVLALMTAWRGSNL